MSDEETISQAAFAREHGVSRQWIHKLVKSGVLHKKNGKLIKKQAEQAYKAIDRYPERTEQAQTQKRTKRKPSKEKKRGNKRKAAKRRPRKKKPPKQPKVEPNQGDAELSGEIPKESIDDLINMSRKAKIRESIIKTELKKLELEKKRGEVVYIKDVERDARKTGAYIRNSLLGMAHRLALQLECDCRRAVEVELIISEEVNRALKAINESSYT